MFDGHFIDDPLVVLNQKIDFCNMGIPPIHVEKSVSKRFIKDSGVCFRGDESLYLSSRKLYLPFKRYDHGDHVLVTGHLSGCSLRRCKFPMISCHHCAFEY